MWGESKQRRRKQTAPHSREKPRVGSPLSFLPFPPSKMAGLLSPAKLKQLATSLLPPPQPGSPDLTAPIQAAAALVHAIHTALGFRLVEPPPAATSEGEAAAREELKNRLPLGWSATGTKFKYRHDQSSLEFVINLAELGGRGMIAAVAVEDHKSVSFDFLLTDYFSASAFPVTFPTPDSPGSAPDAFAALFSSPTRLVDLVTLYRLNILQPLIPGLRKEGYTELPASTPTSSTSAAAGSSGGAGRVDSPTGPYYPDRGGPMGMYPVGGGGGRQPPGGIGGIGPFPPRGGGGGNYGGGGQNPFNIGRSDLDPLGGRAPQFPGFPGTAGPSFGGGMGGIGGGGGGGMFVGPDHPLFRERFGNDNTGVRGPWGGDGYLPAGSVPPGARFDPVGPANGPPQPGGVGIGGFGGGQGIGSFTPGGGTTPRGGPAGPGLVRREDPDWDELPPPGPSNDYDAMFG